MTSFNIETAFASIKWLMNTRTKERAFLTVTDITAVAFSLISVQKVF